MECIIPISDWVPLQVGWHTLNTDGSVNTDKRIVGGGGV